MLTSLTVQNIVLIDRAQIALGEGFCVLTGETGAGKSILLDALGLVLGARAEGRLVREGQEKGSVIAEFSADTAIAHLLDEHEIEHDGELVVRRVVSSDGKSKAYLNDTPVSVNLLKQLGEALVEVHGQHDQRGLLDASTHGAILDAFGGLLGDVIKLRQLHADWKAQEKQLKALESEVNKAQREEEFLRHAVDELREFGPEDGEEERLAEQRSRMQQQGKIIETLQAALGAITDGQDIVSALGSAERTITRSNCPEDIIEAASVALDKASIEAQEAVSVLERLLQDVSEPVDIEQVEERLFKLRDLARKYQVTPDGLSNFLEESAMTLATIERADGELKQLRQAVAEAKAGYHEKAEALQAKRAKAATAFKKAVESELAPLKMADASINVVAKALEEAQWHQDGIERISFEVRTNKGGAFGPLSKIASGGELSRFMLALKVVMAGKGARPTMIFDEIDTGIGGATADAVGKRLAALAEHVQVLCVTHQPQVASYGTHHLFIEKQSGKSSTQTSIVELDDGARKEELARMLAGAQVSDEARAAAVKLMEAV